MEEIAQELDSAIDKNRHHRLEEVCSKNITLAHRSPVRQFVFNKSMDQLIPDSDLNALEENVRAEMLRRVKQEFGRLNAAEITDRLSLPDTRGDLWIFHLHPIKDYSALGGPVVFCNLQPAACEWSAVRP